MKEKLYPFSAKKHIHDLYFRANRARNEECFALKEQLDKIICKASGGVSPIWLTGKEYALAIESVFWAAEHRR